VYLGAPGHCGDLDVVLNVLIDNYLHVKISALLVAFWA
jgi:hypothetical protein